MYVTRRSSAGDMRTTTPIRILDCFLNTALQLPPPYFAVHAAPSPGNVTLLDGAA